ncbi:helix-turn-helix domain-containing protein [Kitasatospora sp. CM 4170]|uniref:Helix-turn-helix transcriptional regulator n=1 Tax=Kitasatospora aburaviensis TaxID=67265 RepID=A0ABW1F019_9ACTN|nr:helix-turn-helix domain-containing protein [Kitasatospora sp. CM 4170]WNM47335.1 helix-turn-helix domain-containing protein [Kitasatospora sp. CM 4170]
METSLPNTSRTAVVARRPLATAEELAAYLGVPLGTVYAWRHRSQGPAAIKVGRHLRYRWAEVEAWLDAQSAGQAA